MNFFLYWLAKAFVFLVQMLPLKLVALIGRVFGFFFYYIDRRHRRVAVNNLFACLCKSYSQKEIFAIARENFCRIGEVYLSALKTASIPDKDIGSILSAKGAENLNFSKREDGSMPSFFFALGHFGNFELYAKTGVFVPNYEFATTYRGFRQPWLERLILSLREKSGVSFFERRFEGKKLRSFMSSPSTITGLLVDQHARRGVRLPFFDLPCSVSPSPALFALRYKLHLHCCFCRRLGLGRWEIEVGPKIASLFGDSPRPIEDILSDINSQFESFILEDPANWFWVHDRWKLRPLS